MNWLCHLGLHRWKWVMVEAMPFPYGIKGRIQRCTRPGCNAEKV